jgi:AraC-like DNA-binding protein
VDAWLTTVSRRLAPAGAWRYWRPAETGLTEVAVVTGREVGLPAHFHEEHQFTLVLSGRRTFKVGGRELRLAPGQCGWLPALAPHESLSEPDGVACVNWYAPGREYDAEAVTRAIELAWANRTRLTTTEVAVVLERHRLDKYSTASAPLVPVGQSVARTAAEAGLSREAYTRRFAARVGMSPGAYRRIVQLNLARELLRANEDLASTAVAAGFADQSHLGRWFRRTFGTTPGRYRERGSQTF